MIWLCKEVGGGGTCLDHMEQEVRPDLEPVSLRLTVKEKSYQEKKENYPYSSQSRKSLPAFFHCLYLVAIRVIICIFYISFQLYYT